MMDCVFSLVGLWSVCYHQLLRVRDRQNQTYRFVLNLCQESGNYADPGAACRWTTSVTFRWTCMSGDSSDSQTNWLRSNHAGTKRDIEPSRVGSIVSVQQRSCEWNANWSLRDQCKWNLIILGNALQANCSHLQIELLRSPHQPKSPKACWSSF